MTNEGGGIYSPDHWDPCPCEDCKQRELEEQQQEKRNSTDE